MRILFPCSSFCRQECSSSSSVILMMHWASTVCDNLSQDLEERVDRL